MNRNRDARAGLLFALPWILGFGIFMVYPVVASFLYSFTNYSVLTPPKFIGFDNYSELFHDEVFYKTLVNTFLYSLGAVPLGTIVAIGLAMLLNNKVKGLAIYRAMFFVPSLVPLIALGTLFMWVFNGDFGVLKEIMKAVHIPSPNWMGDPAWAKWTLIIIAVWGSGQAMLIYLAGLQNVPVALYEAADLDGARSWAKLKSVTIPMISPVILFNVIMGIIGSLQIFAVPYIMFSGGQPARSTYFYTSYLFDNAFMYQRMGFASAMGWVMFLITLALTLIALKFSERHVHYEAG